MGVAVQKAEAHAERSEALGEVSIVLFAQNCRGAKDGDLAAILYDLEGGTDGDFGLSKANVSADEAVHRPRQLKVLLGLRDRQLLAGGLHPREGLLHLVLEGGVRRKGSPLH